MGRIQSLEPEVEILDTSVFLLGIRFLLTYGLTEMSYIITHLLFNQYIDIIKPSVLAGNNS